MSSQDRSVAAVPALPPDGSGGIGLALIHAAIRGALVAYNVALRGARAIGRPTRPLDGRASRILLTGTFNSTEWVEHHLRPLARSTGCAGVTVVSTSPMPLVDKVVVVRPPEWLVRTTGSAAARLATLAVLAFRDRPDIVGGFHLLFNGLAAAMIAPLVGARSMYFCVGGPMEVLDGGIKAENKLFNKLKTPDTAIERLLVRAITSFDIIITMGHGAKAFLRARGVSADVHVIPGGLDPSRYCPSALPISTDIMFVGRLAPIKRPLLLLEAIRRVKDRLPGVSATIVGDGQMRDEIEQASRDLGLDDTVVFAGHRSDVRDLLPRARLFVLTSESEGVSLSLMEALACGVPAVVPNVGDLGDVLVDGVNGFLVEASTPEAFAGRMTDLLIDERFRLQCSAAARRTSALYTVDAITLRWDELLRAIPEGKPAETTERLTASRDTASASSRG